MQRGARAGHADASHCAWQEQPISGRFQPSPSLLHLIPPRVRKLVATTHLERKTRLTDTIFLKGVCGYFGMLNGGPYLIHKPLDYSVSMAIWYFNFQGMKTFLADLQGYRLACFENSYKPFRLFAVNLYLIAVYICLIHSAWRQLLWLCLFPSSFQTLKVLDKTELSGSSSWGLLVMEVVVPL